MRSSNPDRSWELLKVCVCIALGVTCHSVARLLPQRPDIGPAHARQAPAHPGGCLYLPEKQDMHNKMRHIRYSFVERETLD